MTFDWQNVLALTVVLAAAVYLARRVWGQITARRAIRGCTHCSTCASSADPGRQVVPLKLGERGS